MLRFEWLRFGLPRLHWLMYGLFYPAILGTVIVFVLQHIASPPPGHAVSGAQLSVALTAGAFFSLSFGSALKQEEHYGIAAFVLDAAELGLIIWCFFFLRLVDPIPEKFGSDPSPWLAYVMLAGTVVFQFMWRWAVRLKVNTFIDLKVLLVVLLILGAVANGRGWDEVSLINWSITSVFAALALAYVASHPYERNKQGRTFFFQFWVPLHGDAKAEAPVTRV